MTRVCPFVTKSIASVSNRFRRELKQIVREAWSSGGTVTRDMRSLIHQYVEDAYFEGLKAGDVSADEMTSEDAATIDELDSNQQDYIRDFAKAVKDANGDKQAQRDILNRIDLWTASIEAAGMQGLASAKSNEMVTWHLGTTEEHCKTCNQLNGQRHRRKWFADKNYFPRTPGAALECGGFNCMCTLE